MRFRSVGYTARLPTMDYGANGLRSRRILREATRRGKTPRTTASSIINLGVPLDLSKHLPGHCTPENCWISRLDKQEHRLTAFHQVRTVTTSTLAQVLTGKLVATGQNYTRGTSKKKKRDGNTGNSSSHALLFTNQASVWIHTVERNSVAFPGSYTRYRFFLGGAKGVWHDRMGFCARGCRKVWSCPSAAFVIILRRSRGTEETRRIDIHIESVWVWVWVRGEGNWNQSCARLTCTYFNLPFSPD
jgi:hypothetical protein